MKIITTLTLTLITFSNFYAQNTKSKNIKVPVISYPTELPVKNVTTYFIDTLNKENESSGIDSEELKKAVNLQSFTFDDEKPHISFFISGISATNLNTNTKRSKTQKKYEISISPKESATIKVLTIVNGTSSHLLQIPLKARKNDNKVEIPEVITVTFKEQDKYLEFLTDDKYQMKPALISRYINLLTEGKLLEQIESYIKKRYDTRIDLEYVAFNYLKDKKDPSLQETTKNSLIEFEKALANVSSFETLKSKQAIITDFEKFWKEKLEASLAIGKKNKKTSWDLTKNMYNISLLSNNFRQAYQYFSEMEALDVRKLSMFVLRGNNKELIENYNKNFDTNNERLYADSYEVEPFLASLNNEVESDNYSKKNDLSRVPGYIITSEGEKKEGKISLRFSPAAPTQGNIVDVSVGSGKSLALFYVNEKGKDRSKSYKAKNIKKFVVNNKTYEPVFPKKNVLGGAVNALELSLNNALFMELIYFEGEVKLFKDQMEKGSYFLKIPSEKKAFPVSTKKNWEKYFSTCSAVVEKASSEEASFTEETIITLSKLYAS